MKFTLVEKIFREMDSLLTSFFSRNFCQKRVTLNFRICHTVPSLECFCARKTNNPTACHVSQHLVKSCFWSDLDH